jgi:hypothetical protein
VRRCHHCGGRLGLVVHRKRSLRFCKLACKRAYAGGQRRDARMLRLVSAPLRSTREKVSYALIALHLISSQSAASCALDSLIGRGLQGKPISAFPEDVGLRSSGRTSVAHATYRDLLADLQATSASAPSLGSSISSRVRSLLPSLPDACIRILRNASAHLGERFQQRLCPTIEASLLGDTASVDGIALRLARDAWAIADNRTRVGL